jgi:hypothetical protein
MSHGMMVFWTLRCESPPRPWPAQVLPYAVGTFLGITPSEWTLTEASRRVELDR